MKRFTARTLPALAAAAAAVCAFCSCGRSYPANTDEDITAFLSDCGITVTGSAEVKDIVIPERFGEVYERYNELQREQGFDLSAYRSREAEVYTFPVISAHGEHLDMTEAHVIVCDGYIIGGDISSPAIDGGMDKLIP